MNEGLARTFVAELRGYPVQQALQADREAGHDVHLHMAAQVAKFPVENFRTGLGEVVSGFLNRELKESISGMAG